MTNNLSKESREFYNARISELYKIIDNYEGIVRDYISLVNSMQKEINQLQDQNVLYHHRLHTADEYIESRKENMCVDHYNDLVYIINDSGLDSTW